MLYKMLKKIFDINSTLGAVYNQGYREHTKD